MSENKPFLLKGKVGILNQDDMRFKPPVEVMVRLAQNGFKLHYQDKDFVAKTLDEAMEMIRVWFKNEMKEAKKEKQEG